MATLSDIRLVERTGSSDNEREQLNASLSAIKTALEDGIVVEALQEEIDPTVPSWVKNITQSDLAGWVKADEDETISGDWTITGAWSYGNYVDFSEVSTPAAPGADTVRLYASDEQGVHTFLHVVDASGSDIELGRDSKHVVRNNSGAAISKGEPLYITGSSGNVATVEPAVADANNLDRAEVAGVADEDIADNGFGLMVQQGDLKGVDLSAFTEGDDLYLNGVPGALTTSSPTPPAPRVQVGTVLKATAAGILFVNPRIDVLESDYTRRSVDEAVTGDWSFSKAVQTGLDDFIRDNKPRRIIDANGYHQGITVTNSNGTRVNSQGFIESVPDNTLRWDHDPLTGAVIGPLIEEARTNLLTYSEDLSNAAWTKTPDVSIGTAISKGGLSLDQIVNDGTTTFEYVNQSIGAIANNEYVSFSCFITDGTSDTTSLYLLDSTSSSRLVINWGANGVPTLSASNYVGDLTRVDDYIEHVGGGLYRVVIIAQNLSGASTTVSCRYYVTWSQTPAAVGEYAYAGGFQFEKASSLSSYIRTEATAVTRTADYIVIDGAAFGQFWNPDEGTIVVEYSASAVGDLATVFEVKPSSDLLLRLWSTGAGSWTMRYENGAADRFHSFADQSVNRMVTAVGNSLATTYSEGVLRNEQALSQSLDANIITIGGRGTNYLNGHIRQLTYYPTRLTNAELEMISVVGRDILGEWGKPSTLDSKTVVKLGGDFGASFELELNRTGNTVTAQTVGTVTFTSGSIANSTTGVVPSAFRPTNDVFNVYFADANRVYICGVKSNGTFVIAAHDWAGGFPTFASSTVAASVSYSV